MSAEAAGHPALTPELLAAIAGQIAAAFAARPPEAEGLDATAAARFLGISRSKIHDMNTHGLLPAPAEFGDRCPRWSRSELRAWLLAGAPSRARWAGIRAAAMRSAG